MSRIHAIAAAGPRLKSWSRHVRRQICFTLVLCFAAACSSAALAQSASNPSGLPLPRFVTTRSAPVNVRVGPGTRYDIAWVFVSAGQPVEIIQEFDVWRKIRDSEGAEGWIHQNLLSGSRAGLVTPPAGDGDTPLRDRPDEEGAVRAWLGPGFLVGIEGCEQGWCAASAAGDGRTYKGYIRQTALWGVYPEETF